MEEANRRDGEPPGSSSRPGGAHLAAMYVYPVKSAKGSALDRSSVVPTGLQYDRRWMVVDEDGTFMTQRTTPKLCLIETELTADSLVLRSEGHGEVSVPLAEQPGPSMDVVVWDDTLPALVAGADVSAFLSDFLGTPSHLVRMPDAGLRHVPRRGGNASHRAIDQVGFADAHPFLLISQASLDLLNDKLRAAGSAPISMDRFRPNLVVDGVGAHEEDTWSHLRIGDIDFVVAKPCVRCSVPSVDQETGVMGREPLRTLATYRREGSKVLFGQKLVHDQDGALEVGAKVVARRAPVPA